MKYELSQAEVTILRNVKNVAAPTSRPQKGGLPTVPATLIILRTLLVC